MFFKDCFHCRWHVLLSLKCINRDSMIKSSSSYKKSHKQVNKQIYRLLNEETFINRYWFKRTSCFYVIIMYLFWWVTNNRMRDCIQEQVVRETIHIPGVAIPSCAGCWGELSSTSDSFSSSSSVEGSAFCTTLMSGNGGPYSGVPRIESYWLPLHKVAIVRL